jgi:hypothetical protein
MFLSSQWSIRAGFSTLLTGAQYWELLTDSNLACFNKRLTDAVDAEYRQYYQGRPYPEGTLAGAHHPIIGSGSAEIRFAHGTKATICDIFYQDPNL